MSSLDAIERVAKPVEQEQPAQLVSLQVIEQETRTARGNQSEAMGKFSVRVRAATALAEAGSTPKRWPARASRVKCDV